jgi:hypothetical protein
MDAQLFASQCVHLQRKLGECRQHLAAAEAATTAFASAKHGAEIRRHCASAAEAATLVAAAATSVTMAANAVTKILPDQESAVAYKIAATKRLCQKYKVNPMKLLSEGHLEAELGKPCEVIAVGTYEQAGARQPAELDSKFEVVIIVPNRDSPVSESTVKNAVKRIVKQRILGASGMTLGNPRVTKVKMISNPPEKEEPMNESPELVTKNTFLQTPGVPAPRRASSMPPVVRHLL